MREKDIDIGGGGVARPGKRRKHLKVYHTLFESNYRQAAKTLRKIAREIERGDYNDVHEGALVLDCNNGEFETFGFGPQFKDAYGTMCLFDFGKEKVQRHILDIKERQRLEHVPPPKKTD